MPRQYGHSKKALREYKRAEDRVAALLQEHFDKLDLAHGQEGDDERSAPGRQGQPLQ